MISEKLDKTVSQLFKDNDISFLPFGNGEDLYIYEIDIGLNKPCRFYKRKNCGIYEMRPMNCRTFPYWLINHNIPNDVNCIQGLKLSDLNKEKYRNYEKKVGHILITQSENTDMFLSKIGAKKVIDLRGNREFEDLVSKFLKEKDTEKQKVITRKMISKTASMINHKEFQKFIPIIETEISKNNYEKLIDNLIDAEIELEK